MGGPGLGRDMAINRVGPFVVHGCNEDVGVESGDQPTDLGSALLSSRMVGVYRA
jgi:hypothetical protein